MEAVTIALARYWRRMSRRHFALAIAVMVVWGLNFVIIDEGLKVFPPLFFVALRFVVVLSRPSSW